MSLFILVVHPNRAAARAGEILGKAARVILIAALIELPVVAYIASREQPEVIGGALFVASLTPLFLQGLIVVFRGVRMVAADR